MIKSILLPIDGSVYTDTVIQYGIELAHKLDARLRILTIVDIRIYEWVMNTGGEGYMPVIPATVFQSESNRFMNERADTLLAKVSEKLARQEVSFDVQKIDGSPVEVICDFARQVDLVLMGSRGDYAKWGNRLLGATVESVSRQCATPILIVEKDFTPIQMIICAYDRSEYSNRALKLSAYLAQTLGLQMEVLTINDDQEERKSVLDEAAKYLDPYKLQVQFRHEAGYPADIIIQATKDAPALALLIMGSYGHSRIREAILGGTTVQVMRGALKPILLAK